MAPKNGKKEFVLIYKKIKKPKMKQNRTLEKINVSNCGMLELFKIYFIIKKKYNYSLEKAIQLAILTIKARRIDCIKRTTAIKAIK